MNEEEKNNAQSGNETKNSGDSAQNTANMVKDAANLAKNIANKNAAGIAKNAMSLLKNEQFRKVLIVGIISPIIIIVLIAGSFFGILNSVGEFFEDIGEGFVSIGESIIDAFQPIVDDTGIQISDNQVDAIINGIDSMGLSLEGLKLIGDVDYSDETNAEKNQEALRKYIRKFYQAQEVSRTLNTKVNYREEELAGENPFGQVYVHRAIISGGTVVLPEVITEIKITEENQLDYMKYEDFITNINELNGSDIHIETAKHYLKYFTVNPDNGNMLIASLYEQSDMFTIKIKEIDYKSAIEQYTTPMDFLIYLAMLAQNPEFASKVADLVADCEIRIMVLDEVYSSTETVINTYTLNTKNIVNNGTDEDPKYEQEGEVQLEEGVVYSEETNKTVEYKPRVVVTYAKTWFSEQEITYDIIKEGKPDESGTDTTGETITEESSLDDKEPTEYTQTGTLTWETNHKKIINTTESTIQYTTKTFGDVKDRTGEKGSQGVNASGEVDENTTFIGLLDDEFDIPNSSRTAAAGSNIVSGAEMLFNLLSRNSQTEQLEVVMRYILNKYTNTNKYGNKTWEDISGSIAIHEVSTGANYNVNTEMSVKEQCITDAEVLKEAIKKIYSGQRADNLTNEVSNFIAMQDKYHVNAVFAMAVTVVESGGGTNWNAIDSNTYNWYSIRGNDDWKEYSSFKEATMDFGNLIANSEYYFKANKYTVKEIAPVYCDNNWGETVIPVMNEIYKAAGVDVDTEGYITGGFVTGSVQNSGGFATGGVQTETEAADLQSYIETELISTKEHKNSEYQKGPFAKWWPGNNRFQCTWWVYGRASMYLENNGNKTYPTEGYVNGGEWYSANKINGWFEYGSKPRPHSIISWSNGLYGHVAYVEGVTTDGIYISHAGNGTSWFGIDKISLDGDLSSIGWSGYTLNGYIYLDEPIREQ